MDRPVDRRGLPRHSRGVATLVPDPDNVESVTRDPDDDYLVALARTHGADHIISGDKDLLEWASQDRFVLSPSAFADLLAR